VSARSVDVGAGIWAQIVNWHQLMLFCERDQSAVQPLKSGSHCTMFLLLDTKMQYFHDLWHVGSIGCTKKEEPG
jgi:hypothetical protein